MSAPFRSPVPESTPRDRALFRVNPMSYLVIAIVVLSIAWPVTSYPLAFGWLVLLPIAFGWWVARTSTPARRRGGAPVDLAQPPVRSVGRGQGVMFPEGIRTPGHHSTVHSRWAGSPSMICPGSPRQRWTDPRPLQHSCSPARADLRRALPDERVRPKPFPRAARYQPPGRRARGRRRSAWVPSVRTAGSRPPGRSRRRTIRRAPRPHGPAPHPSSNRRT